MAAAATGVVKSGLRSAVSAFFEYDTPKIVHIQSKKVGVINRLIQICILAYIIGYAIIYKKGYQDFGDIESAATTKVKGVVYTNSSNYSRVLNQRIWDVVDYVNPPQELDAFFVMTNLVATLNQTQGKCPEDPDTNPEEALCTTNSDCTEGQPVTNGNGVKTGLCVESDIQPGVKVCEIYAWCRVEKEKLPQPALLRDSKTFTVLIKNSISFPKFNVKRRNILATTNNATYLRSCKYNSSDETDMFCPIFVLGTIMQEAGQDYDEIAYKGGVIAINIHWDCNLDLATTSCKPVYTFTRLDDQNAAIAKGWNFRYANYYEEGGVQKRDLFKAYGIRFVIKVTGRAGKFSVVPLLLNIGSGLGLLAVATVLCDVVVLYVLKKGPYYQEKKKKKKQKAASATLR